MEQLFCTLERERERESINVIVVDAIIHIDLSSKIVRNLCSIICRMKKGF